MGDDEQVDYRDSLAGLATRGCRFLEAQLEIESAEPILYVRAERLWEHVLQQAGAEGKLLPRDAAEVSPELRVRYYVAEFALARALDAAHGRTESVLDYIRAQPDQVPQLQDLLAPDLHEEMFRQVQALAAPVNALHSAGAQLKTLSHQLAALSSGLGGDRAARAWTVQASKHFESMSQVCILAQRYRDKLVTDTTLLSSLRAGLKPRPVIGLTVHEYKGVLDTDLDRLRNAGVPVPVLADIFYSHESGTPDSRAGKVRSRLARFYERIPKGTTRKKKKSERGPVATGTSTQFFGHKPGRKGA